MVSELIQALTGTNGQTNMAMLIGAFCDNANTPGTEYVECQFTSFYGCETWTILELLLLASRERYLWESELTWLVNYVTNDDYCDI